VSAQQISLAEGRAWRKQKRTYHEGRLHHRQNPPLVQTQLLGFLHLDALLVHHLHGVELARGALFAAVDETEASAAKHAEEREVVLRHGLALQVQEPEVLGVQLAHFEVVHVLVLQVLEDDVLHRVEHVGVDRLIAARPKLALFCPAHTPLECQETRINHHHSAQCIAYVLQHPDELGVRAASEPEGAR
jgi:hypothetical protein